MRILFLLTTFLALTGCSYEKKTETCTFNGNPVDCSELNSRRSQDTVNTRISVNVSLRAEMKLDTHEIRILENAEDSDSARANGTELTCYLRVNADQAISHTLMSNGILFLRNFSDSNDSIQFKRVSGQGVFGIWVNEKRENSNLNVKTVLEILNNQIRINRTCTLN